MCFTAEPAPLFAETIDLLPIEPSRDELLRYLGYPKRSTEWRNLPDAVEQVLLEGQSHLFPRGTYSIYRVKEQGPRALTIGGTVIKGQVATFLRGASRIVVFLATVGSRITELSRAASLKGDIVVAWALDALGSWAAEAATHALATRLETHLGSSEALSPRYSPGYCGMNLTEQCGLFELVDAGAVGVTLLPSMLMQPIKSVSGLVGLGDKKDIEVHYSPCDRCTDVNCTMRR